MLFCKILKISLFLLLLQIFALAKVDLGSDVFFENGLPEVIKGKRVGIISHQAAINSDLQTTLDVLKKYAHECKIAAIFSPEHGFYGNSYAGEHVDDQKIDGITTYSLHGTMRRPTKEMLSEIDVLICDLQDIGSRSYTFISTMFYCMEEAAVHNIKFIVLDRPNPMGGRIVDGPLSEKRSFVGYINAPYCHGMTIGELANFFNQEYKIGCDLTVISMRGWRRDMTFEKTGLHWMPTSPQIPESDTALFYPATGIIGHLSIVSTGIGYTVPFKVIGAPWIKANVLSGFLNKQNLPGVFFRPFFFKPFFGKFNNENCQGIYIIVTDVQKFLPVATQFTILGAIKQLYPDSFQEGLKKLSNDENSKELFTKIVGSDKVLDLLLKEKYIMWPMRKICAEDRHKFIEIRKKYLLY